MRQTYSTTYIYGRNDGTAIHQNTVVDFEKKISELAAEGYIVTGTISATVYYPAVGHAPWVVILQRADKQPASYFQNLAADVRAQTDTAVHLEIASAKTELADQLNAIAANSLNEQNRQFFIDYINQELEKRIDNIRQAITDAIANQ